VTDPELHSPYRDEGTWFRGNLHAHSTRSDGVRAPEHVVADYAARGYDFLAVSDHDLFTDPAEYRTGTAPALVPAVEISADGPHVLHVGATGAVDPHENRQAVVDAVREEEGIAVPAHPNWQASFAHWPQSELERIEGYAGIEIYNGLIENHPGAASATDRWDQLLSAGRRVWGFANDDSHRPWEVARAWNVVQLEAGDGSPDPSAIVDALAAGRFYATTGVSVRDVAVSGGRLRVETAAADRIRLVSDHGVVQQTAAGPSATFRVPDQLVHRSEHSYVRVECLGRGGDAAWLQPMFLE